MLQGSCKSLGHAGRRLEAGQGRQAVSGREDGIVTWPGCSFSGRFFWPVVATGTNSIYEGKGTREAGSCVWIRVDWITWIDWIEPADE